VTRRRSRRAHPGRGARDPPPKEAPRSVPFGHAPYAWRRMGFPLWVSLFGGGASEEGFQRGKPRRGRRGTSFASASVEAWAGRGIHILRAPPQEAGWRTDRKKSGDNRGKTFASDIKGCSGKDGPGVPASITSLVSQVPDEPEIHSERGKGPARWTITVAFATHRL